MSANLIVVGKKPIGNYVLAIAHRTGSGEKPILTARGQWVGKSVVVAMKASDAALGLAPRPMTARIAQESHPGGGRIAVIEIPLAGEGISAPATSPERPVVVGSKDAAVYAMAIRTRFQAGAQQVILRARGEGLIAKAISAAFQAANLGFCQEPSVARIGEEDAPKCAGKGDGRRIAFIEIVLTLPATTAGAVA